MKSCLCSGELALAGLLAVLLTGCSEREVDRDPVLFSPCESDDDCEDSPTECLADQDYDPEAECTPASLTPCDPTCTFSCERDEDCPKTEFRQPCPQHHDCRGGVCVPAVCFAADAHADRRSRI